LMKVRNSNKSRILAFVTGMVDQEPLAVRAQSIRPPRQPIRD
jgi:hypothetical protein